MRHHIVYFLIIMYNSLLKRQNQSDNKLINIRLTWFGVLKFKNISLNIYSYHENSVEVYVLPHTAELTWIGLKKPCVSIDLCETESLQLVRRTSFAEVRALISLAAIFFELILAVVNHGRTAVPLFGCFNISEL